MEDKLELVTNNRDDFIFLKKLKKPNGEESKTYILKTNASSIKYEYIDKIRRLLKPSGCNYPIIEGEVLEGFTYIVKSIIYTPGLGYTITFE